MTRLRQRLRKYFIMGSQDCTRDPIDTLQAAIEGGITAFQYREKGADALTGDAKIKLGQKLRHICRKNNVLFFVNDNVDLVDQLDADGVHLGQDDMAIEEFIKQFPSKWVGLSVSNMQELKKSPIELIDYIGAGSIFTTTSKKDAQTPVGIDWIKTLRKRFPLLPIVGIGGITTDNAHQVIEAGADGVSVISAIAQADDIKKAVQQL